MQKPNNIFAYFSASGLLLIKPCRQQHSLNSLSAFAYLIFLSQSNQSRLRLKIPGLRNVICRSFSGMKIIHIFFFHASSWKTKQLACQNHIVYK